MKESVIFGGKIKVFLFGEDFLYSEIPNQKESESSPT